MTNLSEAVLLGVVTEKTGYRVRVRVDEPPREELRWHDLTEKQANKAEVGDRVELRYITVSKTSGMWWITRVLQ